MYLRSLCGVFLCLQLAASAYGWGIDSLGIKSEESQVFVIHQVDAGETLYSLSKRYGTTVTAILENNQISGSNLAVNSILKVPWPYGVTHRVQPGETLYALSKRYQVTVDEIRRVNNLASNELEVGKNLIIILKQDKTPDSQPGVMTSEFHIVEEKETLYSISKNHQIDLELLKSWNQLDDNLVQTGDTLLLAEPATAGKREQELPQIQQPTPVLQTSAVSIEEQPQQEFTSKKNVVVAPVKENGIAAVIDGNSDTRKYLALHPTAPVGTIMRVRNEMTNLSVFVRVVGKLPATGANNNVLIRLSPAAQEALGALDGKFRVELSYVPN